jgi:hypothetical protein
MPGYRAEQFGTIKAETFDALPPVNVDELGEPVKHLGGTGKGSVVFYVHVVSVFPVSYKSPQFSSARS